MLSQYINSLFEEDRSVAKDIPLPQQPPTMSPRSVDEFSKGPQSPKDDDWCRWKASPGNKNVNGSDQNLQSPRREVSANGKSLIARLYKSKQDMHESLVPPFVTVPEKKTKKKKSRSLDQNFEQDTSKSEHHRSSDLSNKGSKPPRRRSLLSSSPYDELDKASLHKLSQNVEKLSYSKISSMSPRGQTSRKSITITAAMSASATPTKSARRLDEERDTSDSGEVLTGPSLVASMCNFPHLEQEDSKEPETTSLLDQDNNYEYMQKILQRQRLRKSHVERSRERAALERSPAKVQRELVEDAQRSANHFDRIAADLQRKQRALHRDVKDTDSHKDHDTTQQRQVPLTSRRQSMPF